MRDIARPMEIAKDARVYDVRIAIVVTLRCKLNFAKYCGFFLEARPMQVPYEVSVTEHWTVGHFRKPAKKPPPPRSAEFDDIIYREMGMIATEPNIEPDEDQDEGQEEDTLPKDTTWNFDLYTHEHLLTLKFYVHMLRDTVEYFFETAGYDHAYSLQPYTWNHVTAVLAVPEPGSSAPCA